MPRKAPDKVIEHRISLSNFERSQIIEQLQLNRDSAIINAGISQVGTMIGSGVLLYGIAGYLGINLISKGKDLFDDVTKTMSDYLFDALTAGMPNADPVKEAKFANAFDRIDEAQIVQRELDTVATAELVGIRRAAADTGSINVTAEMLAVVERIRLIQNLRKAIEITRDRVREFNRSYVSNPDANNCPDWLGLPTWQEILLACDNYPNNVMPNWEPLFEEVPGSQS